ncbi:hypothetical protein SAMN02745166_04191 [Prosthecobacter debontii]|uniref:Uncharacterized protein n=1 Tax=Prosthecobacter debontii TaxID=48467 RepID=A0A1T4YV99_9BACT|nr:hypothetical protein [Prosthecobacter debontii]SKB05165.1 hypothetical protein SAMN02745166_04191 [Prosthecobacter debontii]
MPHSDQKSATGQSAQDLIDYIDNQQSRMQSRQTSDLARLGGMGEGPARDTLAQVVKDRAAVMDQNEDYKNRLDQGEHPGSVQQDMVQKNAYLAQPDDKARLQAAAANLPPANTSTRPPMHQMQADQLVQLACMDANQLREKIDNASIRVDSNQDMAGYLHDDGDHIMAEVLEADANEAANLQAVLECFEEAKLNVQPVDQDKLAGALSNLTAASGDLSEARLKADQDKRSLFQSEIDAEIGPELEAMGLTAEERAIVVKAVADYSLDHDDLKPNVANAQGVAQQALEGLQNGNYSHQNPADPSDKRIQDAVHRALGVKQVIGNDGQITTERPDVKNLQQGKFNETLDSAKAHVAAFGPDSVIGPQAQQAGQQVKNNLNNWQPPVQAAPANNIAPAEQTAEAPKQKTSVRDMLRGAADRVSNAASNLKATITDKVDQLKLERLEKQLEKRQNHQGKLESQLTAMGDLDPRPERDARLAELQKQYDPTKLDSKQQIDIANEIDEIKAANKLEDRSAKNAAKVDKLGDKVKAQEDKIKLRADRKDNAHKHQQSASVSVA